MISERDKRLALAFIGSALVTVIVLFVSGPMSGMQFSWHPAQQVRFIRQFDEQFELIWESSPIYSGTQTDNGKIYLTSIGQAAFILASFDARRRTSLYKLDISTGNVVWQILDKRSFLLREPINLASNSQSIFVGLDSTGRVDHEDMWAASRVVAYDPANGQEVWSQPIGGARSVDILVVTESIVSVKGFSYYYVLDAESGAVLEKISRAEEEPRGYVLFMDENISYELEGDSIQAIDKRTSQRLWVQQPYGCCIYEPSVVTDKLLIVHGNPVVGWVQAFDRHTGELVWQYDANSVVSNLAMGDNAVVYFVTEEAHLVAVDGHTGQELGRVEFGTAATTDQSTAYDVTASQDFVLVYMGDGQKLFAFRFLGGDE
jgi:outer membrane protein assembly factor BamB